MRADEEGLARAIHCLDKEEAGYFEKVVDELKREYQNIRKVRR